MLKNEIFIQIHDISDEDGDVEDEDIDDEDNDFENEDESIDISDTYVSVYAIVQGEAYIFTLAVIDKSLVPPFSLYRMILDIVEVIGDGTDASLIEDLTNASLMVQSCKDQKKKQRNELIDFVSTSLKSAQ